MEAASDYLRALARRNEQNLTAMGLFSRLLRVEGALFSPEEVSAFARDCGLPLPEAFRILLSSACGLESDRNPAHRQLEREYLFPALRSLSPAPYRQNPYCRGIRFPKAKSGAWEWTDLQYAPYQVFPCGNTVLLPDGREIPPLGYFQESFSYPAVLENGREWMTITPNEVETMAEDIAAAQGNIAVFGLGLGYYALMSSGKAEVASVTIIEKEEEAIRLFREALLPQFPQKEKIRIVRQDALDYWMGPMAREKFDFAFVDLWHDVADGLPMYLRFRRMESLCPGVRVRYWIEPTMLIFLRGLLIDDLTSGAKHLDNLLPRDDPAALSAALSLEGLRRLAPGISPEEVRPSI